MALQYINFFNNFLSKCSKFQGKRDSQAIASHKIHFLLIIFPSNSLKFPSFSLSLLQIIQIQVKDTCKELKHKIRENSNREAMHVKKPEKTYTKRNRSLDTFQIYDTSMVTSFSPSTYLESPSTSSGSSPSDMNILQELEAQGILNTSSLSTVEASSTADESCNLIDLSSDGSCDNIAKFEQLSLNGGKATNGTTAGSSRDPFGSSELLSDVMSELYKANKNQWTTFE